MTIENELIYLKFLHSLEYEERKKGLFGKETALILEKARIEFIKLSKNKI